MEAKEFKANCLNVIQSVELTREPILVTKHGKPHAKVVPIGMEDDSIFGFMQGKFEIVGDIESPVVAPEEWAVISQTKTAKKQKSVRRKKKR